MVDEGILRLAGRESTRSGAFTGPATRQRLAGFRLHGRVLTTDVQRGPRERRAHTIDKPRVFANRAEAGRRLAERLVARPRNGPCVVLALPRGGVPIGAVVARALGAPLDLLLVRKIGAPGQPELAVAAVVDGTPPQLVVDETICAELGVERHYIEEQKVGELREIERRRLAYLRGREPLDITGATVIVVDDGIATGTTVRAALRALRQRRPQRLVLAVPVAPADTLAALQGEVDEIVCLQTPWPFHAIGQFYRDFHQVSDGEVLAELDALAAPAPDPPT